MPRHLTIAPGDLVVCSPLHAKLSARSCVARQQLARLRPPTHAQCRACPDGERFAEAAGLDPNARDLIAESVKAVDRQQRAGKHAHTTGQSFRRPDDESEAA